MPVIPSKFAIVLAALAVAYGTAGVPSGAFAQQPPTVAAKPVAPPAPNAPVKNELSKIFEKLSQDLKSADALVARLKATALRSPESAKAEVNEAARMLSDFADRLKPTGDVAAQLQALRNAATIHRKRVAELSAKDIDEADRQTILSTWDDLLQTADATAAAMGDMKGKINSALENLRMRQVAVSEMLLVDHHRGAIAALQKWLGDLETTIGELHKALDQAKPKATS